MDIRAPQANRGAGFKSQGRYRPDAVSARPMGHLFASLAQHLIEESVHLLSVRIPLDQDHIAVHQLPPSRPPTPQ
jgi:hypothetical protein